MRRNKRAQVPVGVEGGGDSEPGDRAMANPLAANPLPVPADADGARAADTGAESFEIEGVVESPASTGQDEATGDGLAQRIFLLFDEPESSRAATIVSSVVLLLILVSSVVFVVVRPAPRATGGGARAMPRRGNALPPPTGLL